MIPRRLAILAVVGGVLAALGVSYALGTPTHRPKFDECFPKQAWNAPDQFRPCVRIIDVYEDGSIELGVYDHNGTERYTYGVGALDQ